MVPGNARRRHPVIEQRMVDVAAAAETYPFNRIEPGDKSLGIITRAWPTSTPKRSSRPRPCSSWA
jgi:TPP-dependent indolepyruvate ferredoxin oxidoreductase alpha subunit